MGTSYGDVVMNEIMILSLLKHFLRIYKPQNCQIKCSFLCWLKLKISLGQLVFQSERVVMTPIHARTELSRSATNESPTCVNKCVLYVDISTNIYVYKTFPWLQVLVGYGFHRDEGVVTMTSRCICSRFNILPSEILVK